MKIWIDLANSPQVLFFRPIIEEIERRGHTVTVTSRDYAQTVGLADLYSIRHTVLGGHGGSRLSSIGYRLLERAWKLAVFAQGKMFDLAVSHGSYAQALAAAPLRIPFVSLMDYEHQPANHISFRLARKVIVPDCFPGWALRKYGAGTKALYYQGLKEQVYIAGFAPDAGFLTSEGLVTDRILVVMRPPASWSLYHHFENPLFHEALEHVAGRADTFVVFLPRVQSQVSSSLCSKYSNIWIPEQPLDGLNLLYHADVVISAGGTMNREAALLGASTYSVFRGRLAAVDRQLIELGRLQHIQEERDLWKIKLRKRHERIPWTQPGLVDQITEMIMDGAE